MQNQNLMNISGIFLENHSIRKILFPMSTTLTIDISLSGKSFDEKTWWLTGIFIQTTAAIKLALFANKNITVNAYFFKTGKLKKFPPEPYWNSYQPDLHRGLYYQL